MATPPTPTPTPTRERMDIVEQKYPVFTFPLSYEYGLYNILLAEMEKYEKRTHYTIMVLDTYFLYEMLNII